MPCRGSIGGGSRMGRRRPIVTGCGYGS